MLFDEIIKLFGNRINLFVLLLAVGRSVVVWSKIVSRVFLIGNDLQVYLTLHTFTGRLTKLEPEDPSSPANDVPVSISRRKLGIKGLQIKSKSPRLSSNCLALICSSPNASDLLPLRLVTMIAIPDPVISPRGSSRKYLALDTLCVEQPAAQTRVHSSWICSLNTTVASNSVSYKISRKTEPSTKLLMVFPSDAVAYLASPFHF